MDTLEWFCSDDVSNGFIEDCSDDDDDCANGLTDVCGICGGAGPEYICSDGNPACNEEECNALVANHFFPAYLEESDNPYMAMNVNVTSALLDGFDLETGDEIGIFDGDVCVGVGVVDGTIEAPGNMLAIVPSTTPTQTQTSPSKIPISSPVSKSNPSNNAEVTFTFIAMYGLSDSSKYAGKK
jgi:hypothetical protein